LGGLALVGCGENKLATTVSDAYRLAFLGHPDVPISRSTVTNLPYASIAAKIGKGPRSLLILWRTEGDQLHWLSADNAAIVTRGGRVVRTAGLPENMKATHSLTADPLVSGLQRPDGPSGHTRSVDFDQPTRYGLLIDSSFRAIGEERITIAEIEFDTVVFEERCIVRTLNWTFTNRYWIDPVDGFVWRSEQTIARTFPTIEIEVLKPAG